MSEEKQHRSKERIKKYGEVFTPKKVINDMLDLIGDSDSPIWSDENVVFFEPTCGNGNICSAIVELSLIHI